MPVLQPKTSCTTQDSEIICQPSSTNSLSSVVIGAKSSGQITLVQTKVSTVTSEANNSISALAPTNEPKMKKRPQVVREKRAPVPIAPKPVVIHTIAVASADIEAGSNYVEKFGASDFAKVTSQGASNHNKIQMKTKSHLKSKSIRKGRMAEHFVKHSKPDAPNLPPRQITPLMTTLLKIAKEACKTITIPEHEPPEEVPQMSEVVLNTTPDSSGFVTTSSTVRRSQVRQLNFGESIGLPLSVEKSTKKSPIVLKRRAEISEDRALENTIAVPAPPPSPSHGDFAPTIGKAKRARTQTNQPQAEAASTSSTTSEHIISSTPLEKAACSNVAFNLAAQCVRQSSTTFGEIPQTQQILFSSSTSPLQVSLTKGFRILPAANSTSLAVPATTCTVEASSNLSNPIETVFYPFSSLLNTPR